MPKGAEVPDLCDINCHTVDFKYKGQKVFGDLGQMSLVPGSLVLEINCILIKLKT